MIRAAAIGLTFLAATAVQAQGVNSSDSAVLRALDKVSGEITDIEISRGETRTEGRLSITMSDCRYPSDNPSGNAYAFLTIRDTNRDTLAFSGWMVAAAPALNGLDDPRYDVWVLRCSTS